MRIFDVNPALFLIVAGLLMPATIALILTTRCLLPSLTKSPLEAAADKIWKYVIFLVASGTCIQLCWQYLKKFDLVVEIEPVEDERAVDEEEGF